jgi:hypothetical protein
MYPPPHMTHMYPPPHIGSHATLRAMFPEHDDSRVEVIHLIMVGEQVTSSSYDMANRYPPPHMIHVCHMRRRIHTHHGRRAGDRKGRGTP